MSKELSKDETKKMKDSLRPRRDSKGNIVPIRDVPSHDNNVTSKMEKAMLAKFD